MDINTVVFHLDSITSIETLVVPKTPGQTELNICLTFGLGDLPRKKTCNLRKGVYGGSAKDKKSVLYVVLLFELIERSNISQFVNVTYNVCQLTYNTILADRMDIHLAEALPDCCH